MARSSKQRRISTPAAMCRVPIFAPTRRGSTVVCHHVESSWGSATITGRLDQRHRDVIDALLAVQQGHRQASVHGDVAVLVDSADLRRQLGWDRWRYEHIISALRDLRAAEIEMRLGDGTTSWSGILTHIMESASAPPPRHRGARSADITPEPGRTDVRGGAMWEITVSGAWIALTRHLPCRYPDAVLRMKRGVVQALARFILSHRDPQISINAALDAIGVDPRQRSRARRWVRDEAESLAAVGVKVAGNMLTADERPVPVAEHPVPVDEHSVPVKKRPVPVPIDI